MRRTRLVALVLIAALVLSLVAGGIAVFLSGRQGDAVQERETSSPAAAPTAGADGLERFYDQPIAWQLCAEGLQCGTLEVPLDYDEPAGETLTLALLRAPARDQDARLGSLVVNPGGPGASGVEYAAAADFIVTEAVRDRYDIVGLDPRGVASSEPIDCVDDADLDVLLATDGSPDDEDEVAALVGATAAFAEGCEERSGLLLPHVATEDVARDLDVLRGALGDERLSFLGKSYGTFIGATYLRLFPERAGRLVLDGVVDPALTAEEFALGQAAGFERALTAFLTDCVELDECPVGDDVEKGRRAVAELLGSIDAKPLPTNDSDGRELTEALAVLGIAWPLYLLPEQGYARLRDALDQAQSGEGSLLLQLSDSYAQRLPDGTFRGNLNEATNAVNCVDRGNTAGPDEIAASLPDFRAASPTFGDYLAWGGTVCAQWPVPAVGEPAPVRAEGAAPVLVVGTTGDSATPYEWAQSLAEQLESGVLLTYEGAVHTAYVEGSECIDEAVDAYLLDGVPPVEGLRCE